MRWVFAFCLFASSLAASPFSVRPHVESQGGLTFLDVALTIPEKHLVYAASFSVTSDVPMRGIAIAQPHEKEDPFAPGKKVLVYTDALTGRWQLDGLKEGTLLRVTFQGCNEKTCFLPEKKAFRYSAASNAFLMATDSAAFFTPRGADDPWRMGRSLTAAGGYMTAGEFLAFLDQAEGRPVVQHAAWRDFLNHPREFLRARGIWMTLVLVLLGGLLLNLTPCVLPMIPINLAIIGAGSGTRRRGFFLGSAYGAGMVLVYGGMGWGILRSGLFFGALQASPWFSLTVAAIFAGLALALFDVIVIDFTRWTSGAGRTSGRNGFWPAFSAGGLSALLAGACVAPVVLAVLLLAGTLHAQGESAAQLLPFLLGLGMALPWPFAGAGLSVLPRPGMWMVRVKQVFGLLVAGLAVYYASLAVTGFIPALAADRPGSIEAGDRVAWQAHLEAARASGKPVFVDFWASWCKNCTAMEKTTFQDPRVKARLEQYHGVMVRVERPNEPAARAMLESLGVKGLPAFVILR